MRNEDHMQNNDRRVRVLCVIPSFITGGAERIVLDLMHFLDRQRFDIATISLFPYSGMVFEREAADAGLQVFYLSKRIGPSLNILTQLNSVVRAFRPDVLHSHLYIMHYVLPVCLWNNVPVRVHTLHNPVDIKMPEKWRQMLYRSAFQRFNFRPISISSSVRASARALCDPIESPIIYNGTDTSRFRNNTNERLAWRAGHSVAPDAWVYVNIARLHRQKNHRLLIEAFRDVVEHIPHALLLLVGSGAQRAEIEQQVAALGLQQKVLLLGDRRDIEDILNASDALVSTSDCEGFGITVVEAMAAGRPVVATAVGGVPESMAHGKTGFLVPPGDRQQLVKAMLVLHANQDLARWMGDQGRRVAREKFDVREMARQYGQLYIDLFEDLQRRQALADAPPV
jgi:glycosyltransferase involved in cell wall biosynthesis